MTLLCPSPQCTRRDPVGPTPSHPVRHGVFFRKSDSRSIPRYRCPSCKKTFSRATFSPRYRQKRRRINEPLGVLICSGVSQRRAALILGVNPKTVVSRLRFLAHLASESRQASLASQIPHLREIQFDDLETSEHTKCKPLSVAIAVDPKTRKILSFQVSRMPAKGLLARIARKKYGPRPDERKSGWEALFLDLARIARPDVTIRSDENPFYPAFVKKHFPVATHLPVPGGRAAIAGQGELKKKKFDPLFALNHTCAMLRANMNRLFRRTWCTTKTIQGLKDHLELYVQFHNERLTPS